MDGNLNLIMLMYRATEHGKVKHDAADPTPFFPCLGFIAFLHTVFFTETQTTVLHEYTQHRKSCLLTHLFGDKDKPARI